ncbi:MAG: hypothetical protein ABSF41_16570 [Pseudolabrys sp.]|jgi:hypothetical protein
MSEPQIVCPNCHAEIKPTESLAAPLIAETRKRFEQQPKRERISPNARRACVRPSLSAPKVSFTRAGLHPILAQIAADGT